MPLQGLLGTKLWDDSNKPLNELVWVQTSDSQNWFGLFSIFKF